MGGARGGFFRAEIFSLRERVSRRERGGTEDLEAGVAKLADAPDLGSGAARHVGSTPIARTNKKRSFVLRFFYG